MATGAGSTTPTVVFFHAHPDDEAIFTGGTMRLLADRGVRVVLVVATRGELGEVSDDDSPLAHRRETETRAAADVLGVTALHFLGYHDSGIDPGSAGGHPGAKPFATASVDEAADRLAAVLAAEHADALVTYDEHGIYGHPDHVQVHDVGVTAAGRAGVGCRYDSTVDREYLHFVETHLVVEAGQALSLPEGATGGLGLAATTVGMPSIFIDCTVDVRAVVGAKRAAMLAHASQIPPTSSAVRLSDADFAGVYGYEWYLRHGPPGPLDVLARP